MANPPWKTRLKRIAEAVEHWQSRPQPDDPLRGGQLLYGLDVDGLFARNQVRVQLFSTRPLKNDRWSEPVRRRLRCATLSGLREASDRRALRALAADNPGMVELGLCRVADEHAPEVLAELCGTGRFRPMRGGRLAEEPLVWDGERRWELELEVREGAGGASARPFLRRGDERLPLERPEVLYGTGWFLVDRSIARFDARGAFGWILELRSAPSIALPPETVDTFIDSLLALPSCPRLALPPRWQAGPPREEVAGLVEVGASESKRHLPVELRFLYEDEEVASDDPRRSLRAGDQRLVERDLAREEALRGELFDLGLDLSVDARGGLRLPITGFVASVKRLLEAGWRVRAEGRPFRQATGFALKVRSGVDWFDLDGGADYGGQTVPLPKLLRAAQRGQSSIELGDGSRAMLPEDWLEQHAPLLRLAKSNKDGLRFTSSQAWMLDALLGELPDVELDEAFVEARERLRSFDGVEPADASPRFAGTLRPYQRFGLGWLRFLRRFGLGGCLADDMGLGKTIQVLALLQALAEEGALRGPCLVVAPRSVQYNWELECARFAPDLRPVRLAGPKRRTLRKKLAAGDLGILSYGLLRRDIKPLAGMRFDVVVLDEAQAIKNAATQTAKAACRLVAHQRLALSGTPIENRLAELWSLFEFLNPGMLGRASTFRDLVGSERSFDETRRARLERALRPFVVRRTKKEVLDELPEKVEQTLFCELGDAQRKEYDTLLAHYRGNLQVGDGSSRMRVLAALLRLRQAACHLGLIDPARAGEESAKLATLLPLLEELCGEGNKALVFSQFTRFLGLVRSELEERGIPYAYLDGKTRDRAGVVERFQQDPDCGVFLISLKAGGLGLNLTAAGYVFLLDPWWNPAVEAQAIDRAHRIGQRQRVIAYRLIARDTVEEKILALQEEKRQLAAAVLEAGSAAISRDDLARLFS